MFTKLENILNKETFIGEDGLRYEKVTKEISTPRKTYLKGIIAGKYRGSKIEEEFEKSDLFDFEIYEANVSCSSLEDFRKNKPFVFPNDFKNIDTQKEIKGKVFPKEKLPKTLAVIITANEKSFGVNVLEPQLFEFDIVRKFHQTDGDDVFGRFNAYITGYVFDYEKEIVEEIIGPIIETIPLPPKPPINCECSNIETGRTESKSNYIRKEYVCKHHKDTVWGDWQYTEKPIINTPTGGSGCLSDILTVIGLLLGLAFLIAVLPGLLYFIGFYIIIFLLGFIAPYLKWIFRIIGVILLLGFIAALINAFNHRAPVYNPTPLVTDTPREVNPVIEPIIDTNDTTTEDSSTENEVDSIITRYRKWKDYDGNQYEGKYQIKLSDNKKAHSHKDGLSLNQNSINSYDKVISNLKQFDKDKLNSVYSLFDSIGKKNQLNKIKFAEMIVTFVQDIPYAIVLENGCDASLYNDRFTRNYLLNHSGECDANQRFGINTPIEFLVNLKGDCDTRTLLLYTILAHYNYDVALMSSELYGHSIIGINLPIEGIAYIYQSQRYVLWETTTPNAKPGDIPNEISNLNNWRISLKSK